MDETTREALTAYVRDLFAPEDALLRAVWDESAARGLPAVHIRPEEGRMIQLLLAAVGARRVVELGTLAGYSAIWIARALPAGGRLISLEHDTERAATARLLIKRAGLSDRVEVRCAAAPAALADLLREGPFDAVFIDADKPRMLDYLGWALEAVRAGGLIMAHNAFMRGRIVDPDQRSDAAVRAMDAFNHAIAADPRLLGMIIPLGDGISVALRLHPAQAG